MSSYKDQIAEKEKEITKLRNCLQVVIQMRKAQKAYFSGRTQTSLIDSKRLETSVDIRLIEIGMKAI